METTSIYTLSNPISGVIGYVGQTTSPKKRLKNHVRSHKKGNIHIWVQELQSQGLRPQMDIIDTVPISETDFWERHYISLFRSWGFDLKNIQLGGKLGKVVGAATKKKISMAHMGKVLSEETKSKMKVAGIMNHSQRMRSDRNPMRDAELVKKKIETCRTRGVFYRNSERLRINKIRSKPVVQFDKEDNFIKEWPSVKEAGDALKICRVNIARVAHGKKWMKSAGGFKWKFKNNNQCLS